MTDLASRSDTEGIAVPAASSPAASEDDVRASAGAEPTLEPVLEPEVQWAPAEKAPRKRRLWLWLGIPAALLVGGAAAASAVLIAPGTTIAGVPVGLMTPGAATDTVQQRLAEMTVTVGEGGPSLSGADLGASVDAAALASSAFAERPAWNLGQWFGGAVDADLTLTPEVAAAALRAALPGSYTDPTPASVVFDGAAFTVTPAVDGVGIDIDALAADLETAFLENASTLEVTPLSVPVAAAASTENAQAAADEVNALLPVAGFYVGDERTVPLDAAFVANWITVTPGPDGVFAITADSQKIQASVDALPALVNRPAVNGGVIVNAAGEELGTSTPGHDGRALEDTSSLAGDVATALADGNGVFALPVTVTPAVMTRQERLLEVNLTEQRMYMKENGVVMDSWYVSTGRPGAETETGRYTIGWKTPSQTMRGTAPDSGVVYEQPDVRWAMYFNGDQAFHGVYWHSNWGNQMSAGCVGMPNFRAEQIYAWAPSGVDVWVHY